jgi:hypothetical protein
VSDAARADVRHADPARWVNQYATDGQRLRLTEDRRTEHDRASNG